MHTSMRIAFFGGLHHLSLFSACCKLDAADSLHAVRKSLVAFQMLMVTWHSGSRSEVA